MRFKRFLSVSMSIILMVCLLPGAGRARADSVDDAEGTNQLVVHYDMTEKDGKLVDVSGNGLDGTCIGLSDANFVTEDNEKVLEFTGDKGQFVKLPKGCIPGEEFTIEASVKTDVRADHWLYCFGTKEGKYPNVNNYIFCNPNQNNGTIRMGLKNSDKELLSQKGKIESGKYNTITATFKDGVMAVYVNGKFIESVKHDYKIMDILKNGVENEEDCIGYLGKSIFTPDPAFTGKLSDFKIYNYAKSEDEITKVEEKTDQEIVDLAKSELNIPDASNIRGNVTLPTSLEGAAISWKSSNEAVISTAVKENKNYDETPAGVVTRQAEDTKVTITATISYKEITTTKEFTLTVKAKAKKLTNEDYGGYLFVHFTGESDEGEQIYFSLSKDGLHWNDVNDGDPVLISGLGEKGVRDPFILRSPDGDKFYIIATDLRIANKKGWSVAQYSGSRSLIIWESDDLVHWSDPRSVEVGIDGAGCVWAPEAIYDKKTGEYMVFWASMVQEENETQAKQRIYCAKTRDFVTFTKPQKYIERDNHVIDTTIIENEGQYYRYSKDETTKRVGIDTSNQLLHSTFTPIESETLSNLQGVEGPLIFKFNGQKKWCLMVDQYSSGKGYLPLITDDLSSGKFTKLSSDEYSLGSNLKRHGTVLNLTNIEYDAIAKKWASTSEGLNEEEKQEPVLNYNFEDSSDTTAIKDTSGNNRNGSLAGSAKVVRDEEKNSNVLYLDGTTETYAAFPQGFFDGRNTMTISMDVKADTVTGDFFTFTIGKNNTKYLFLRTRDKQIRNALTISSYSAEQEAVATTKDSIKGKWMNLKLVITPTSMAIYRDGELISENDQVTIKMSDLGKNLFAYLGKSFYSGDAFFKGWFDNVKVYNRALSGAEIASEFGKEEDTIGDVKADGYHIIKNEINKDEHTITLDVSRTNSDKKELGETKVTFNMRNGATIEGGNEVSLDLTKDSKIKVQSANGTVKEWKVKAVLCYNNILKGLYADPDIDVFGDTYYIYPTTDGATGWSGTKFHVFSSKDLVDWSDEGVILDVSTDDVKWAVGSAWAPTIEEKNRKYYFYFCAKREDGKSCIGVAVSDSPKGPFKAMDTPLITPEIASEKGISMGQTIDPSIFTDEDGSSYLYFGNGKPAVVQLNDDMTSVKEGTMKNINGLSNFRESLVVVKRNGIYHFTWSCNDTGSENYEVRYGTSDSPYGDVTYQYPVLQKDSEQDILGTGHQSILKIPGKDEYYMVYHRFGTPLDNYGSSVKGYNRETCLDSLTFGEDGKMKAVTPTLAGISKKVLLTKSEVTPTATPTAEPEQSPVVTPTQAPEKSPAITPTEAPKQSPAVTPTVTPSANPVQPGKNAATVAKVTGVKVLSQTTTSIKISWKKSKNVAGYEVFQKKNSNWKKIKVLNGNKNTWTIKKLSSAKSYQFKVRAFAVASGKKVYGKFSGVLKAVTAPKAPSGIKLLKKNGKATLSWKKVGGATSYVVYRYDTKTKRYKRVATMASKKCSYSSSKFKKGVKVRYKVKACKGKVFSKFSLGKTLKI